ncbi:hypothetical protein ASD15_08860 [Massilia sp. Root351]|jgi:hypothetical protein|uniref:hypothetical protein n=1 Tax=Massilia sp. Root351 TaxID=1736522 RepID=UPI00070C860B|nr:hypothetical protein [Massilia sp. Root351]KQV82172.1 hypothetical protein ASD15_08860 [Massilia sp. Root351]
MEDNLKSFLDSIQQEFPNAVPTDECNPARHTPDTLEEARQKVVKKLQLNKTYFENGGKPAAGEKKLDTVFKKMPNGTYSIGVKYGNRWLQDIFGAGKKMYRNLRKDQMVKMFDKLIAAAEAKAFDEAILVVMASNLAAKQGDGDE